MLLGTQNFRELLAREPRSSTWSASGRSVEREGVCSPYKHALHFFSMLYAAFLAGTLDIGLHAEQQ